MGFSRQEYWSGLPCPPPDLPSPGTEPVSLKSPSLAGKFFTTSATWKPKMLLMLINCVRHNFHETRFCILWRWCWLRCPHALYPPPMLSLLWDTPGAFCVAPKCPGKLASGEGPFVPCFYLSPTNHSPLVFLLDTSNLTPFLSFLLTSPSFPTQPTSPSVNSTTSCCITWVQSPEVDACPLVPSLPPLHLIVIRTGHTGSHQVPASLLGICT